jgi:diaminopimelate decarboxylase
MLDINTIERLDKIATPFYYYDVELFHKTVDHVAELARAHDIKVHYAIKANVERRLLSTSVPRASVQTA